MSQSPAVLLESLSKAKAELRVTKKLLQRQLAPRGQPASRKGPPDRLARHLIRNQSAFRDRPTTKVLMES
jgi:hypothetical protein